MPVISFIYGDTKEDIADPERVMRKMVEQYNVKRDGIFHGVRGRENKARKVAMYLMSAVANRTLPEIAD
jgi:chromosomal replication initiation ATPase DnaA